MKMLINFLIYIASYDLSFPFLQALRSTLMKQEIKLRKFWAFCFDCCVEPQLTWRCFQISSNWSFDFRQLIQSHLRQVRAHPLVYVQDVCGLETKLDTFYSTLQTRNSMANYKVSYIGCMPVITMLLRAMMVVLIVILQVLDLNNQHWLVDLPAVLG